MNVNLASCTDDSCSFEVLLGKCVSESAAREALVPDQLGATHKSALAEEQLQAVEELCHRLFFHGTNQRAQDQPSRLAEQIHQVPSLVMAIAARGLR